MKKTSIIRIIYIYLFSAIGLILLIIGVVRFIDMGFKVFVFKEAEKEESLLYKRPPLDCYSLPIEKIKESNDFSEKEKKELKNLVKRYEEWQKEQKEINYLKARREKNASISLAMIFVGLPLYVYHWYIAKKDFKETLKEETET